MMILTKWYFHSWSLCEAVSRLCTEATLSNVLDPHRWKPAQTPALGGLTEEDKPSSFLAAINFIS